VTIRGRGRLGSRELTAGSDLDLVALYDFDEERRESTGPRRLDAVVYHIRLIQRLVAAMTVPSRRGRLYEVDLRLRPQGGKSPLATQFRGFTAYQASDAEMWEHMALTRARPLAGDESLGAEAAGAIREVLTLPRDRAHVYREVRSMRALIAREKGEGDPFDVKLAAGGLTDLDFLAQALQLAHAHRHPELAGLPTARVLEAAAPLGLLDEADARLLQGAHGTMCDLLHWQRLAIDGPFDAAKVPRAILRRLAAVAGLPAAHTLREHLLETQGEVRRVFERVLG
jgi:glutamate-ammonia-ligase adenylyltransferase